MDIKRPKDSEMCPPGEHWVRAHNRCNKSGTTSWVKRHTKDGDILWPENIYYLYWHSKSVYPPLKTVHGFPANSEIDSVIQFWMNYWANQGLSFPPIDPLLIKALIAVESDQVFDPLLNIALGTRGLFYKYTKIPRRSDKNIFNTIKNYYSWNKEGEDYAKKVTSLFKKSK